MIANACTAVVGLFHDPAQAVRAVEELRRSGIREERIVVWAAHRGSGPTVGELIRLGVPEEEARVYHAEMMAGRTLVVVQADLHLSAVVDVMARFGGYEVAVPA
jgi:hypothetical protein